MRTTATRSITLITSQNNITLNSGWNLISLPMKNTDTGTDRNISLVKGWNLIGYNGAVNTSLSNAKFNNGSNSYTWAQALANNKVQAYLAYYDNNAQDSLTQYKYMSTLPGLDDYLFRQNKGYVMYVNDENGGTLIIPSIGGTLSNQTYNYDKLRFSNGNYEKNITDAIQAGWIPSGNIRYWGCDPELEDLCNNPYYWEFLYIDSSGTKGKTNLNSLEGTFVYSNLDNITLIRQN